MINEQRSLALPGIGDLLKRSWQIYKVRFGVFLGIIILPLIVVGALAAIQFITVLLTKRLDQLLIWLPAIFIFYLMTIIALFQSKVALVYAIKDHQEKIGIR